MIYSKRNKNKKVDPDSVTLIGGAFAFHHEFVFKDWEGERRRLEVHKLLFRVAECERIVQRLWVPHDIYRAPEGLSEGRGALRFPC